MIDPAYIAAAVAAIPDAELVGGTDASVFVRKGRSRYEVDVVDGDGVTRTPDECAALLRAAAEQP